MSPTTNFGNECSSLRTQVKAIGAVMLNLKNGISARPSVVGQDTAEMIANVTLTYRHLEDVAMRLGKAIQAYEGGKSIYDTNDAIRVAANGPMQACAYATQVSNSPDLPSGLIGRSVQS